MGNSGVRYHISDSGEPAICHAQSPESCPCRKNGDIDDNGNLIGNGHYPSKKAARDAIEHRNAMLNKGKGGMVKNGKKSFFSRLTMHPDNSISNSPINNLINGHGRMMASELYSSIDTIRDTMSKQESDDTIGRLMASNDLVIDGLSDDELRSALNAKRDYTENKKERYVPNEYDAYGNEIHGFTVTRYESTRRGDNPEDNWYHIPVDTVNMNHIDENGNMKIVRLSQDMLGRDKGDVRVSDSPDYSSTWNTGSVGINDSSRALVAERMSKAKAWNDKVSEHAGGKGFKTESEKLDYAYEAFSHMPYGESMMYAMPGDKVIMTYEGEDGRMGRSEERELKQDKYGRMYFESGSMVYDDFTGEADWVPHKNYIMDSGGNIISDNKSSSYVITGLKPTRRTGDAESTEYDDRVSMQGIRANNKIALQKLRKMADEENGHRREWSSHNALYKKMRPYKPLHSLDDMTESMNKFGFRTMEQGSMDKPVDKDTVEMILMNMR